MRIEKQVPKEGAETVVPSKLQEEARGDCCRTTDDGQAICLVPTAGQTSSCSCQQNGAIAAEKASVAAAKQRQDYRLFPMWRKVRGGVMFAVACVTSPCCTPLFVPLVLVLLAGTPAAVWLSAHLGWVYGGLTLVSVVSLVLGWRWLKQKAPSKQHPKINEPIPSATLFEGKHS